MIGEFPINKIQDIVPVNIKPEQRKKHESVPAHLTKPKVALRLKHGDLDLTFYNDCDKYIVYIVLEELNVYDR